MCMHLIANVCFAIAPLFRKGFEIKEELFLAAAKMLARSLLPLPHYQLQSAQHEHDNTSLGSTSLDSSV